MTMFIQWTHSHVIIFALVDSIWTLVLGSAYHVTKIAMYAKVLKILNVMNAALAITCNLMEILALTAAKTVIMGIPKADIVWNVTLPVKLVMVLVSTRASY